MVLGVSVAARRQPWWAVVLVSGCVGSSGGDDAGSTSGTAEGSTTEPSTVGEASGGAPPPGCGENLLQDPGFEAGVPNPNWDSDSPLFGTPLCNADCTDDVGAGPLVGDWWVWFGGIAMTDTPSVSQSVVIPEGRAMLRFGFSINAAAGDGNDVFRVAVGDETELLITDAEAASYVGWRFMEVDVSNYADGMEHEISFSATLTGGGLTSFFVDEVELLPCEEPGGSSSSSSTGMAIGSSTTGGASSSSGG